MNNIKVVKRDGKIESYKSSKIRNAIRKAGFVDDKTVQDIIKLIEIEGNLRGPLNPMSIELIQDLVLDGLIQSDYPDVAKEYIRYRNTRSLIRDALKTNNSILRLIDDKNLYLKTLNSNKNHVIASTQRDYIAGLVSKDLTMRLLLPKDVVEAHKQGAIHFHNCIVA